MEPNPIGPRSSIQIGRFCSVTNSNHLNKACRSKNRTNALRTEPVHHVTAQGRTNMDRCRPEPTEADQNKPGQNKTMIPARGPQTVLHVNLRLPYGESSKSVCARGYLDGTGQTQCGTSGSRHSPVPVEGIQVFPDIAARNTMLDR